MRKFIDSVLVVLFALLVAIAVFFSFGGVVVFSKNPEAVTSNECKPVETAERQLVFIAGKAEFVTVLSTTCAE